MIKIIQRPLCYLSELWFCWKVGACFRDKIVLMAETLAFHVNHNRFGGRVSARVCIGDVQTEIMMRTYGGDIFIFHEVLKDQVYQINPVRLTRAPKVILDLGANIGLTSLMLAGQFPDARIICVEPHPENIELLRHNLRSLGGRVQIVQAGIADRAGTMRLSLASEHYNASLVRDSESGLQVRTLTMNELMRETGIELIDILKMDIEGAEALILPGKPRWLNELDVMLAELHGSGQDKLVECIREAGLWVELDGSQVSAWRPKLNQP